MTHSHESMSKKPYDSSAPPPSPVASSRRSCVTNEDVLTDFLEHSLRLPDLLLPDKIFPRHKYIENPPKIDFQSLKSLDSDSISKVLDSVASIGCFQLVNYGISSDFVRMVMSEAAGIFRLSPENKAIVTRSPERQYGFEEVQGEEEGELSEEFLWCRDEGLNMEMEGIWPVGYSNFSEKMETLSLDIEKVADRILQVLMTDYLNNGNDVMQGQEFIGPVCYLYKHSSNIPADQWASSLSYDVIKLLIRGIDFSHALCLHVCHGSSEFHVYSKKSWVSFCPDKHALVITVGDQTQALSVGRYKHVIGRPFFKDEKDDCISMAFLYSPDPSTTGSCKPKKEKIISLGQQVMLVIVLSLVYHFSVCIYNNVF
ncbi:DIOX_N domain-containing protein [Cephalotus follicularis]|uniref:DIOX_N domain-containing protein n=1 Tax=Cephalotus follicularis TaxID=3775 RepID=A0A1Q3AZW8_CEPFO|nr:DIOX_N domain-containing protein [Cephalotus follicularis]